MPTIGLKNLHYAVLTTDDSTAVTYGTPELLAKAISANVEPQVNTANFHADDALAETAEAFDSVNVTLNTDDIPKNVQAAILGHTVNSEGVLEQSTSDKAPYVAIGFKSEKANGKYRYVWLFKGKFRPGSSNYQTKEGTPSFQTPTLNGTFLGRKFDEQWRAVVDEDDEGVTQTIIDAWFTKVYEITPVV